MSDDLKSCHDLIDRLLENKLPPTALSLALLIYRESSLVDGKRQTEPIKIAELSTRLNGVQDSTLRQAIGKLEAAGILTTVRDGNGPLIYRLHVERKPTKRTRIRRNIRNVTKD